jgi:hypothetical protein
VQVHLVNVAYNSVFIGEIALPDWDMFHSRHAVAALHAAARAVRRRPRTQPAAMWLQPLCTLPGCSP